MGDALDITPDSILDVKGLCCPMPVVKAKKAIDSLESGQIIEIIGTDAGSKGDMPAWAKRGGHEFLGLNEDEEEDGTVFHFFIKKG